jgi:hypothetical protein
MTAVTNTTSVNWWVRWTVLHSAIYAIAALVTAVLFLVGAAFYSFVWPNVGQLASLALLHVLVSLVGIIAGLVAMVGLLISKPLRGWTALFLTATILTDITGFLFPFSKILPSHAVGILSLVLLVIACIALYSMKLSGAWRWIYVVTAMMSLYLNVCVMIIQGFLKLHMLKALAPTQTESLFVLVQGAVFTFFVIVIIAAAIKFRPRPDGTSPGIYSGSSF